MLLVAAVGVRSCLAAKTLQLQLFDGICKGYTPIHTQMHRHRHRHSTATDTDTSTYPVFVCCGCLFGHSFAGALFTASTMHCGRKATGGHKQVISDVKLKESSKDKLIYSTLQLKKKLME